MHLKMMYCNSSLAGLQLDRVMLQSPVMRVAPAQQTSLCKQAHCAGEAVTVYKHENASVTQPWL
jgi:hypothetical protein